MIVYDNFNSSAIKSIKYDVNTKLLAIQFTSGGIYDYPEVPQDKVEGLINAESAGRYFNQHIKQYSINKKY